ncbi:Lsr2 dimerization domain-containing protein [Amycolatopsis australiensis]|uniref:Lsr2 protein n=1 Tax=Amycolatopsis australiensis TaxID=546364 RepID=A0A1K1T2L0_9PSEU|nr:histone-like nucleoid-structuring protein Lsr2 [Amycolatopsis australiensis]SFW90832.1 Lsr2 protein [Amycolatopsis australiensis]
MARNTAVRVLDDLTGEPAAETVGFGLDGIEYDIDLSFANAEALRELLQRYADAGRRTGGRKRRPRIVPGAKKPRAKATPKTAAKPVAGRRTAKAEPAKTTKAAKAKTTAKAEPAKTTRARKTAEPKKTTRAAARKVPSVTFSAAE